MAIIIHFFSVQCLLTNYTFYHLFARFVIITAVFRVSECRRRASEHVVYLFQMVLAISWAFGSALRVLHISDLENIIMTRQSSQTPLKSVEAKKKISKRLRDATRSSLIIYFSREPKKNVLFETYILKDLLEFFLFLFSQLADLDTRFGQE